MPEHIIGAFILTFIAGMATVFGAVLVIIFGKHLSQYISVALGFSAGVMIYMSFFELLKESNDNFLASGTNYVGGLTALFFVCGLALAMVVDMITHRYLHDSPLPIGENIDINNPSVEFLKQKMLYKTGFFSAVIIAVHNFPEGMITFATASYSLVFGASIAVAVAIHNIPEGICVALPIYYATKNRWRSIYYTFLAGIAEPIGAFLGFMVFYPFISPYSFGIVLAGVAGIMVYVSIDELLPTAVKSGSWHKGLFGLILGMAFMALMINLLP